MCLFGSEGKEIGDKTAEQKDFELTSSHKHTKNHKELQNNHWWKRLEPTREEIFGQQI